MNTFLFIYVVVAIYTMLGFGFRATAINQWLVDNKTKLPKQTLGYELAKCFILWPWFDINKLREKYND